ncbi:MAG: UDP-2,3-diacylglucosamine diphosphatase [Bacteroidota bacterium]
MQKKTYFISDFHLGIPTFEESREREKRIISFLNEIEADCKELYIVGDIFDFWFEFKTVVPKGFVRLLAKLAHFTDSGIPVHVFHGNHDLWQFGYLEKEIGCMVYSKPIIKTIAGKKLYIGHGDGLGPRQFKFKFILGIYRNKFFQRLFAFFHPNIGIGIANWFSHKSKEKTYSDNHAFYGEKEFLIQHARQFLAHENIDFFIFGHRHLPMVYQLTKTSSYINLGDWIEYNTYLVIDEDSVALKSYTSPSESFVYSEK